MVVRVHQAGCDNAPLGQHDLGDWCPQPLTDLGDHAIADQDIGPGQLSAGIVHRHDGIGVSDQDIGHFTLYTSERPLRLRSV
jgi:hypothetical protein